ncbi:hypothetical protein Q31b_23270 [Novipirellula aureliae]|uniref:DUF1294 domain-containing protein n=1 Tax=Novipirellula aureliae TaxID=2527966 RepID=A0A5C6E7V0_9BACT|nr:hypothetical protein Q31b_23270 [Novipirellula aureliae]
MVFVAVLTRTQYIPEYVLWVYLGMSAATFVVYYSDKRAAQKSKWRTQEFTLHMMALTGGWPGALIAQAIFRHKTRKQSFLVLFWATVVLNVAFVALLLSPLQ